MDLLKKFLLIAVIVTSSTFSFHVVTRKPCDSPITYRIGAWSSAFTISEGDFLSAIESAEGVWEGPAGRDLFSYDPDGELAVNLVYDSRQKSSDDTRKLETRIDQAGQTLESLKAQIDEAKLAHQRSSSEYRALLDAAPNTPEARAMLEERRLEANALADKAKALIGRHNMLIENVNSNIAAVNKASDNEFEQGLYVSDEQGQKIDIYEFDNKEELVRVLAHELGHALGIGHNDDPGSVMYYLSNSTSLTLSSSDEGDLKIACQLP